jgi:predicted dienelactone hydrolase
VVIRGERITASGSRRTVLAGCPASGGTLFGMTRLAKAFLVLLFLLPFGCASSDVDGIDTDQTPRARYGGAIGESPVGVIPEARLLDASRNRELVLNIEYPTRPGPHPMIIFSHAFGSAHRDYVGLSSYWASQGYVVVKPRHADGGRAGERPLLTEITDQTTANWRDRARDITFILDSLAALTQKYPELEGKIDATKVGVAGHQYGAHTAALVAGTRTFPGAVSYADARVKAAVLMSPQGSDASLGLTPESWSELRVPVLFMTGSLDAGTRESETVTWRREGFDRAAPGDKWLMLIEGAGNVAFTGRIDRTAQAVTDGRDPLQASNPNDPLRRQPQPVRRDTSGVVRDRNAFGTIRTMSLAFWDTYLRGEAEGRTALEGAATRAGVVLEKR